MLCYVMLCYVMLFFFNFFNFFIICYAFPCSVMCYINTEVFIFDDSSPLADFYSMSYLWFSGLSVLTSFCVGVVVSLIAGKLFTGHRNTN